MRSLAGAVALCIPTRSRAVSSAGAGGPAARTASAHGTAHGTAHPTAHGFARGVVRRIAHPTPRAGVTGANVLTVADLEESPRLIPLFDAIRKIPSVADGIGCKCGCVGQEGIYSLLSCYEGKGMARGCPICQGEGRLVTRLHGEGKSLAEIRTAVDAQFGA